MTLFSNITSLETVAALAASLLEQTSDTVCAAISRQNRLTKPQQAIGGLRNLKFFAGWQGRKRPAIDQTQAIVFAEISVVCAWKQSHPAEWSPH